MIQTTMTQKAREIALRAFGNKDDQFGYPHMRKLDAISAQMENEDCAAFAYLQDVLVNSEMTGKDLIEEGISESVALAVEELKITENEYSDYLRRLVINPIIYPVILMDTYYESDPENYAENNLSTAIQHVVYKAKYRQILSIAKEQGVITDITNHSENKEIHNGNENND